MRLDILGCRAGMPADGQASSGYLVRTAESRILLDCGPGIATALSAGGGVAELTAIFVSHVHLDHCYDLLPLGKTLLARHLRHPAKVLERVPVFVPAGATTMFRTLAALFPVHTMPVLNRAFELAFDLREYEPGTTVALSDCRLSFHELRHAAPDCGIRVDDGTHSLAYTGDTGVTDGLVGLAENVDLFLSEATLEHTDDGPHGHLSAADAARAARAAGARSLVLTHFPTADPAWLAARRAEAVAIFGEPVRLATVRSAGTPYAQQVPC